MKCWITSSVLAPGETLPFRPGTLSALIRLQNDRHVLSFDVSALRADQAALLESEGVKGHTMLKAHCDAFIDRHGNELCVIDHDGEILHAAMEWDSILAWTSGRRRKASVTRKTNETDIQVTVDLDGSGKSNIHTGIGFFDHMLEQIARHGFIDLVISCQGDLQIDEHHTIEDVGIALGEALSKAFGDKKGIERYGFVLPMDEAQAMVALDLSGRPYLVFEGAFSREFVGDFPTEMTKHFFYSLAIAMKATLQIEFKGENDHHQIEACFKGFARALKQAVAGNPKAPDQIPSSKGAL
jgi:imidazoleglycerol-phosphate dehydratase/histidinol-phosphatase